MDYLFEPAPHEHALAFIKAKAPLRKDQFEKLLPELQALAFTVSGINAADALQDIRDTVAQVPAGALVKDVRKQVAAKLAQYLDAEDLQGQLIPADEEEATKRKKQLETRAAMIIRHHGNQAYATTVYQDLQENADIFTHWKYLTVGDGHVRDTHRALDGVILPQDHEFWKTHFPPWEFGCRCQVVPVTRPEYEAHQRSDEAREPHERDTLTDAMLEQLTNERTMLRKIGGEPVKIDLRAPREKMVDHPYIFDPSAFQIPIETLRARYDAETWNDFEKYARKTKLPSGSLWQWLNKGRPRLKKPKPIGKFPDAEDLGGLKVAKQLGGSTGAELVEDQHGRKFVRKRGNSAEHLEEEIAANQMYAAMGVPVPEVRMYASTGRPIMLAEFVRGQQLDAYLKTATAAERDALLAKLREHFVADALMGNYDVAGLGLDNIIVDAAGIPWRIDNGGSLRFRAQGAKKSAFGPVVTELQSMLDAKINPSASRIFKGITEEEMRAQLDVLLTKRAALLEATPAELRDLMVQRLDWLEKRFIPRSFSGAFAQQVQDSRIVGKTWIGDKDLVEDTSILFWQEKDAAGNPVTRAKLRLTQKGSDAVVATLGDDMRRAGPIATSAKRVVPGDVFWQDLVVSIKHVNHHLADGNFTSSKVAVLDSMPAKLEAFLKAHPNDAAVSAMVAYYQEAIAQTKAAMQSKKKTAMFAQFEPPAPAEADAPRRRSTLQVKADDLSWLAKSRERGFAQQQANQVWKQGAYRIESEGGAAAHLVPWTEANGARSAAPYAFRGYVEITVPGAVSAETMEKAASVLRESGVDIAAAPPAYRELLYLRKNLEVQKHPEKTAAAWRAIAEDPALDDAEKVTRLKAWTEKKLKIKLSETYKPEGSANSFGQGWQHWQRFDLPRTQVEQEMAGYVLTHHTSQKVSTVIDSLLEGGGVFTPTTERLRTGVPITAGMSPQADIGTGGANYLFTRIQTESQGRRSSGFAFKIGNLARLDAYSFSSDRYGDVRPAAESSRPDPEKARAVTVEKWKSNATHSGNETIFKWGLSLLDEIAFIKTGNAKERAAVIKIFKQHKYTTLPDGRAIEDVVIE